MEQNGSIIWILRYALQKLSVNLFGGNLSYLEIGSNLQLCVPKFLKRYS